MSEYVADTHALLWQLYAPKRLGRAAREALAQVDRGMSRVWIPAVVVAEAMLVAEKGRLPGLTLERLLARFECFQDADNYRLSALLPDAVLSTHRLTAIPDIFDRLIVAEALQNRMPLLTRDPVIRAAQIVETIWD